MKKKDIVLSEKDQIKKPDYRIPYDEILKIYGINSRKGKNYDIKTYIRRAFIDTYPDKKSWDELLDLEQKKFTYIAMFRFSIALSIFSRICFFFAIS